jgi:hypothetical protein
MRLIKNQSHSKSPSSLRSFAPPPHHNEDGAYPSGPPTEGQTDRIEIPLKVDRYSGGSHMVACMVSPKTEEARADILAAGLTGRFVRSSAFMLGVGFVGEGLRDSG